LGKQDLLLHVEATPERLATPGLGEQRQQAGRKGEITRDPLAADGETQFGQSVKDRGTETTLEVSGGWQATGRLLTGQGHDLLGSDPDTLVDQIVIGRRPVPFDDLAGPETVERLFDVGTGDDREIHGPQSAPGPAAPQACLL
jgi:hypothetical protein